MKNKFLQALSTAINSFLKLDPETKQRFKKLNNKTILIEFLPLHFRFECVFLETGVYLQSPESPAIDATIRGTPLQMMNIFLHKNDRHSFFKNDLVIEGDAEIAQQVIQLFDELNIDWEEYLSLLVGDIPAFKTHQVFNGIKNWFKKADDTMTQNFNEYIHEETEWFPNKESLNDFFADIDNLRMDVDRLAAKVAALKRHFENKNEENS